MKSVSGFNYLIRGFKMMNHPELRMLVWMPMLINIVIFTGLIYLAAHEYQHFLDWVKFHLPDWLKWLQWLLWFIFVIGALLIGSITFTWAANLIAAPFNGFLAERVERIARGEMAVETNSAWQKIFSEIGFAILQQLRLLAYFLPRAVLYFTLLWIPILHMVAVVLWFLFDAWMMALQYIGYSMENHHIPLRGIRTQLAQQRLLSFSFGATVVFITMIPFVNLIVMPAAVIGGTLLWVENYKINNS